MRQPWANLTPLEVVALIDEGQKRVGDSEKLIEAAVAAGLTHDEAEHAIDMVRTAHCRVLFQGIGIRPEQLSSNFEDDPIFREALRRARSTVSPPPPETSVPRRPWWKFW